MPADLIAKAHELKERAEARANAQRALDDEVRAREALKDFAEATTGATRLAAFTAAMRQEQILDSDLSEYARQAAALAESLRTAVPNAAAHELQDIAQKTDRAVTQLRGEVARLLSDDLTRWRQRLPEPSETFLKVLETAAPDEVRATRQSLSDLQARDNPQDPQDVAALSKAAKDLTMSYQRLVAQTPPDVREFLERAPTGVPLRDVDDGVLSWLRANQADAAFVLRLAR